MQLYSVAVQLLLASVAVGQQIYIPAEGPTPRPNCPKHHCNAKRPKFHFEPFQYTLNTTVRHATPAVPQATSPTYAAPPSVLTKLLGDSVKYTTWGNWHPGATPAPNDHQDPYGQAAWMSQWEKANPPGFAKVTAVFNATVSPTPVPAEELILPPADYFGPTDCYNFPPGFAFGVSSSASQIEGATAREGKGPTLLDLLIPGDGDKDYVTNEFYYYFMQDIERVAAMGVKHFSFSISWSRVLPFALPGTPVNQQGLDFYNNVINYVIKKGMVPAVTLLHFDTPLPFYAANQSAVYDKPEIGYVNGAYQNETFVDAYVNYAKIIMTHFADRVPTWFTFNEPLPYSSNGQSVYNVVKAHARVSHFYKEEIHGKGRIGIKFSNNFGVPRNPKSEADVYAADHFNTFQLGAFANPIYLGTDYPESFKRTIKDYVPLSKADLAYFNGTADIFGIDPYTATVISPPEEGNKDSILQCADGKTSPLRPYCVQQTSTNVYGWNIGYRSESYVYITPTFIRSFLNYLYTTWRHPIIISEFGFPIDNEANKELKDQLFDTPRSLYYLSYLSETLKAIWEDGVDVVGAFAWSFADNWEFIFGFGPHFGIQTVNRTTQERRYKKSFFDMMDFVKARGVE